MPAVEKPLIWVGSSKKDLTAFAEDVKDVFGYALHLAQHGEKHLDAKPLKCALKLRQAFRQIVEYGSQVVFT